MILYGFLFFVAFASLVAMTDRRKGLFLFLVVGLVQDPVRKMVPGAPGFFALATAPVLLGIVANLMKTRPGFWREFRRFHPGVAFGMFFFVLSMLPGAAISATYAPGSWMHTLVGAFSYGSVLLGIAIGFYHPRIEVDLGRLLTVYCLLAATMLSGTFLEYFGLFPGWSALGTGVLGFEWIRHIPGVIVKMVAGFFRSPDIMGWHAAMVAMVAGILAFRSRGERRLGWTIVVCWAILAIVLCGRRKMLYMLPIFISCLLWLNWWFGARSRRGGLVGVLALAICLTVAGYQAFNPDTAFVEYYAHDPGDMLERGTSGVKEVQVTFEQSGLWGEGLGFASTGAHHLPAPRPRIWQEGGLERMAVELGLPGLVCFLFFGLQLILGGWRLVRRRITPGSRVFPLAAGLFAVLVANGASFAVSGQHFGDPFISCLIAVVVGLFLSTVRFAVREQSPHHVPVETGGSTARIPATAVGTPSVLPEDIG